MFNIILRNVTYSFCLFHQFCLSQDGYLVEIGTEQEQEWIDVLMSSDITTGAYWLGLSDETQEGIWKWQKSFVEASYTNWCCDRPHTDRKRNCAHIVVDGDEKGNWFDIDCSLDRDYINWGIHAICEKQNTAK